MLASVVFFRTFTCTIIVKLRRKSSNLISSILHLENLTHKYEAHTCLKIWCKTSVMSKILTKGSKKEVKFHTGWFYFKAKSKWLNIYSALSQTLFFEIQYTACDITEQILVLPAIAVHKFTFAKIITNKFEKRIIVGAIAKSYSVCLHYCNINLTALNKFQFLKS